MFESTAAREERVMWPDLFVVRRFFEPDACAEMVAELSVAPAGAAIVYGRGESGIVDVSVRKALRVLPSKTTVETVTGRLMERKEEIERHFDINLNECEDPQFLRYRLGDFFVAHQDGNTGLLRLDTEKRRISTVIFLSPESDTPQPNAHCGGSLVFTDLRVSSFGQKFRIRGTPGMLVAFRSETTHEVTPLTHGERYSIVSWYR